MNEQRAFENPPSAFFILFMLLSLIPGLTLIPIGMVQPNSLILLMGIFCLIIGSLMVWLIDYFLRPPEVVINQEGVILLFKNRRKLAIPFEKIELYSEPSLTRTGKQISCNIKSKDRKTLYSVSEEILEVIKLELYRRSLFHPIKADTYYVDFTG